MVMLLLCDVIDAIIIHQTEDLRISLSDANLLLLLTSEPVSV